MPSRRLGRAEVEAEVRRLAARVGAPDRLLPRFGPGPAAELVVRIEVDGDGYHYVETERGRERGRTTTDSVDALLEAVFVPVTFQLALDYELAHRDPARDPRRLLFARHEALLRRLSPVWAERQAERYAAILQRHPFDDQSGVRAEIARGFREGGASPEDAWARACRLVPLPPVLRSTPPGG